MNVKIYRCRICGDPYIGASLPSRCPYCGAPAKYIVEAKDWDPSEFNADLSDVTRKNLQKALQLELNNASFYECAMNSAKAAGDEYMQLKFKALMKVEREHASAICKYLKTDIPKIIEATCDASASANSAEGYRREGIAINSYAQYRDEADEPHLKEFFNALVEIESDHLDIHAGSTKA